MNTRLRSAFNRLDVQKQNQPHPVPAVLGFTIQGVNTVDVPGRPGYVYVRMRSNLNEVVQAYNDSVSPVYDLPVLLLRDTVDKTRYRIQGRDVGRYQQWGSQSTYQPVHANQHSFNPDAGGGGDIVWVYDRQILPLLVQPSGTRGSAGVTIFPDILYDGDNWRNVGGTGTTSLIVAKPTDNQARLLLVYLNDDMNPAIITGSFFAANITGSTAIAPYIPDPPEFGYPLAAVRLVSGTSVILWDNIYDVRSIFGNVTINSTVSTGSSGGGGGGTSLVVSENNTYKVSGTSSIVFNDASSVKVSGSTAFIEKSYWRQTYIEDEFLNGTGKLSWAIIESAPSIDSEENHPGLVFVSSNNPGRGAIRLNDATLYEDVEYMGWIVRGSSAFGAVTGTMRLGLIYDGGSVRNTATGIYFLYDSQVTGAWTFVCNNFGTNTVTPLGIAYTLNKYFLLEIRRSGAVFDVFINNVYRATVSNNFPATAPLEATADIYSYSTAVSMTVDWFGLKTIPFTQRWTT